MQSLTLAVLAVAGLASATPNLSRRGAFYVCGNNGFRGDCSVDPCALPWCPDFEIGTYNPVGWTHPEPEPVPETTTTTIIPTPTPWTDPTVCPFGTGYFQVCGGNGFRGCCKTDACSSDWCPDYKPGTYKPKQSWEVRRSDPTVCAPGTGFFQVCAANGFRGCCKSDACGASWCADYEPGTYTPKKTDVDEHEWEDETTETETTTTTPPATPYTPAPQPNNGWTDPTVCAAGTGYYQVCASGFKGCCTADACSLGYCPGAAPVPAPAPAPVPAPNPNPSNGGWSDPTVCKAGTGYYQVCGNGFKGCCKADACTLGYCPY